MSTGNDSDPGTSLPVATTEATNLVEKRMKLLCSYGGKILPRPSDGQLKYIGGETRVVCVTRSVSFLDLSKKIEDIFKVGKFVIKYRIMNEDLDTLVSVRCNEDLVHMWEEHDRIMPLGFPTSSAPRFLRLFLFDSPSLSRDHSYLDVINGKQMDPPLNYHLEPSRDCHAKSSSFCNFDGPTAHRVEFPRAGRVVLSPRRNQFPRARSTPNLHGAHQIGGDGAGPSCRTQCGHVYQNPVQLMGPTHQQACGRYDTCRCGSVSRYYPPVPVERPPTRFHSYQNLNLMCQAGSIGFKRTDRFKYGKPENNW
ncbi:Octicosapeptide/Phox/Bem1p [Rhynchospora pubera]|uniref:Octicosapeptide/Phox/Bem1p n=1 Tax=Rhynchospora pubera TaxID=906938 RepID=A0AAV8G0L2_9POAL|nr:Octicosapeptide/Phox/Bem1p [Rhynchospora pubera]